MKKLTRGFTMIELLIVIAVLGILAVAVLAAINPIEQINRGKDTGSRSDAEQLIGGVDRFYTSKGYYPWQDNPNDGRADALNSQLFNTKLLDGTVINNLVAATGELKESFRSRIMRPDYNTLYIYNGGNQGDSTYVCFVPKSDSFLKDADDRADSMPSDFYLSSPTIDGINASCLP